MITTLKKLTHRARRHALAQSVSAWVKAHKLETALILSLVVFSIVAHAWNMFAFPYFENDEATYSSRAWSFVSTGMLDVYTYRYDHAPLGWIGIGGWFVLTGGSFIFDNLLESGRVFMLLVHTASTLLLYVIAKRFAQGKVLAGAVAALIFSISPIGIYFQRRILLDNLMVLAVLASIYVLTKAKVRLKDFVLSGIVFGLSVLVKLNAVLLAPAMLYYVWRRAAKNHRLHAIGYWLAFCGLTISAFFLFALLKNELFAAPLGSDGLPVHVSIVDTFQLQLGRGDFAWPWNPASSFRQALNSWLLKDWYTLAIGIVSTFFVTIIGFFRRKRHPEFLMAALLVWLYILFLARGKIVLDLYVVPLIPLLALNIGLLTAWLADRFIGKAKLAFIIIALGFFGWIYAFKAPLRHFSVNETSNQDQAIAWIKQNVPKDSMIITDNYVYPELAQQEGFENVLYFFNAEYDPEVKAMYDKDWRNFDYIVVTHEIIRQIKSGEVPSTREVFDHAELVADFSSGSSSFIDLPNYISTNGDWVKIYKVKDRNDIVLQVSWEYYFSTFVREYGKVANVGDNPPTTSIDQAMGMQRALEVDNKNAFMGIWQWSKDHLQYRAKDKLLSWLWKTNAKGEYGLADSNNVCAADQQIAEQLHRAAEKWQDSALLAEANQITRDWWRQCVFERGGRLYVASSSDGAIDSRLINPGYFNPSTYRYLATKAPGLGFSRLIDDGYRTLNSIQDSRGYIPNWAVVQPSGARTSAVPDVGAGADDFGPDSLSLVEHLVIDYGLSEDSRALAMLERLKPSVLSYQKARPNDPVANVSVALLSRGLPSAGNPQTLYEQYVHGPYDSKSGRWGDRDDLFSSTMHWRWHSVNSRLKTANTIELR